MKHRLIPTSTRLLGALVLLTAGPACHGGPSTGKGAARPAPAGGPAGSSFGWASDHHTIVARPADAALALTIETDHAKRAEGEELLVRALFRNSGDVDLRFHVPEHRGLIPFPRWCMLRQDGRRFVPHVPSFQSGWSAGGMLGEVVTLGATETRGFEQRLSLFVPEDAKDGSLEALTPLPLAPGRYRLECRYEKADDTVPFAGEGFEIEHRPTAGLWTGTRDATPMDFVVEAPNSPQLRIHAPLEARPAGRYPIEASLHNGGDTPLQIDAPMKLIFFRMGATAETELGPALIARAAGKEGALRIAPGQTLRWSFDAAALPVTKTGRTPEAHATFTDVMRRGLFYCELRSGGGDGKETLRSNAIERRVVH